VVIKKKKSQPGLLPLRQERRAVLVGELADRGEATVPCRSTSEKKKELGRSSFRKKEDSVEGEDAPTIEAPAPPRRR